MLPAGDQGWLITAWSVEGLRRALVVPSDLTVLLAARATRTRDLVLRPIPPQVAARTTAPALRATLRAVAPLGAATPAVVPTTRLAPAAVVLAAPAVTLAPAPGATESEPLLPRIHREVLTIEREQRGMAPAAPRPVPSPPKLTRNR